MRTVCAFCNAVINDGSSPDEPVSHGVCPSCYQRILAEFGFNIRKFLDRLDAPVFLVDSDAKILAANTLARAVTQKPLPLVMGQVCGQVLGCINASLPEGCGKTGRCPDCMIRASVNETYATGQPVIRRAAVLERNDGVDTECSHLFVSTWKDGEIVLLRLEAAGGA